MDEDVEDDAEVIRRHVPFITQQELYRLDAGRPLGVGGFGSVRQVVYEGTEAVVKEPLEDDALPSLLGEARILLELNGDGGAPRLLAVCTTPPALVQEFVGQIYDEYLGRCSVGGFLKSLTSICQRLGEVHAKELVHNDLKVNNITFTGTVCQPVFHIIDFGLGCRLGQAAVEYQ